MTSFITVFCLYWYIDKGDSMNVNVESPGLVRINTYKSFWSNTGLCKICNLKSGKQKCGKISYSFDSKVTFEEIVDWYEMKSNLNEERKRYKVRLFELASGKLKKSETADHQNTQFWSEYFNFQDSFDPTLNMMTPKERKEGASFVHFSPNEIQDEESIQLIHKFDHGNVDIQIGGIGKKKGEFESFMKKERLLDSDMLIEKSHGSVSVRIKVPLLDPKSTFNEQEENIRKCLHACRRLTDWTGRTKKYWLMKVIELRKSL